MIDAGLANILLSESNGQSRTELSLLTSLSSILMSLFMTPISSTQWYSTLQSPPQYHKGLEKGTADTEGLE